MATKNGFDTGKSPFPALILTLCLTAFPSAPTWADADVPDGVFYDTIPGTISGMAVADARRAENPGGGG